MPRIDLFGLIVLFGFAWGVLVIYFAFIEPVLNRMVCRAWGHKRGFGDSCVCDRCGADLPQTRGTRTYGI